MNWKSRELRLSPRIRINLWDLYYCDSDETKAELQQSIRELYPLNISFSALQIIKFRVHFQKMHRISSSFQLGLYFKPDQHVLCCLRSIFCENCVDKCRINVILLMFLSIFLKLDSDYNFGGNYKNKNVENQQRYFQRKTKKKYLQSWAHFYAS